MNRKSPSIAAGYTLLEQALVLPILLVLIFGAVDINNALRAYTAIQEGTRQALRCTYTVDGECLDVTADSRVPLFNWYEIQGGEPGETFGHMYHYEGTESFLQRPIYEVSDFRARVLGQIEYDLSYYEHSAHRRYFPANGSLPGVRVKQSIAPRVSISTPDNVSFRYLNQIGATYQNNLNPTATGIGSIHGSIDVPPPAPGQPQQNQNITLGTVTVSIPPLPTGTGCHRSVPFDSGNAGGAYDPNTTCNEQTGRLVVWARGNSNGSDNGAEAVVEMSISGPGANQDLGGRHFISNVGTRDASLVPRGVPSAYLQSSGGYSEASTYNNIQVQFGAQYTLEFKLRNVAGQDTNGTAEYSLTAIELFLPRFGAGAGPTVACIGGMLLTDGGDVSKCQTPNGEQLTSVTWANPNQHPNNYVASDHPVALSPTTTASNLSVTTLNAELLNAGITQGDLPNYFEAPSPGTPTVESRQAPCSSIGTQQTSQLNPNYGVSQTPDSSGYVTTSAAWDICRNPTNEIGVVSNTRWSVTGYQPIPGNHTAEWPRTSCQETKIPESLLPVAITNYPQRDDGVVAFDHFSTTPIHTGPENDPSNDPNHILATDPLYSCTDYSPSFHVQTVDYDRHYPNLPAESLFAELQHELGCDWEDQVRDAALALGMSSNAYFEASLTDQTVTTLTQPPAECATFWEDPGEPGNLVALVGNPYPYGTTPAECSVSGTYCQVEFVGYDSNTGTKGTVELDFHKAVQDYGFETVRTFYPTAQWNCASDECVDLTIEQQGDTIVAQAKMQVPMNLLFGNSVEFTYSEAETFEGALAR